MQMNNLEARVHYIRESKDLRDEILPQVEDMDQEALGQASI